MSQTTTPSGADVLKQHLEAAEELHGFLAKMIAEKRLTEADIPGEHYSVVTAIDVFALTKGFANSEIAALIARNAELEAERDASKFRSTNRDVVLSDPRPLAERLPSYARQFGNETIFARTIAALLLEAHTALVDCDELRKMAVSALNASDADLAALLAESGTLADRNKVLLEALIDVRDNVRDDSPVMWARVESAIAFGKVRSDG